MFGFAKAAAIGAALSVGAATAYDLPVRKLEAAVGTTKYQDRVLPSSEGAVLINASVETTGSVNAIPRPGKGDRLVQTEARTRTITVESRVADNVSALTRVAPAAVANR